LDGVVIWNSSGFQSGYVALGVRPVRLPLFFFRVKLMP
jgi:hypothetical protein